MELNQEEIQTILSNNPHVKEYLDECHLESEEVQHSRIMLN